MLKKRSGIEEEIALCNIEENRRSTPKIISSSVVKTIYKLKKKACFVLPV